MKVLNLEFCRKIRDFTPISKIERFEDLNVSFTNISDISFIENNKNIKSLDLECCEKIKDFTPISKLERLEFLIVNRTNISDISFLENNKNIEKLNMKMCENINKNHIIFNREDIEIYY